MPRIVGDRATEFFSWFGDRDNVVGKSLSAFADGSVVDGVGSNRIHASAATTGSERNDRPKSVVELFPFLFAHVVDHLVAVSAVAVLG